MNTNIPIEERIRAGIRHGWKVTDLDGTGMDQEADMERAVVALKKLLADVVEFVKPERIDVVGKYEPTDEGGIVVAAGNEIDVNDTGADLVHLAEFAQDTGINMAVDHIEKKQKELGL